MKNSFRTNPTPLAVGRSSVARTPNDRSVACQKHMRVGLQKYTNRKTGIPPAGSSLSRGGGLRRHRSGVRGGPTKQEPAEIQPQSKNPKQKASEEERQ